MVTRRSGISAQRVGAEVVLVNAESQQAHALTAEATSVWELSDGTRTAAQIAAELDLTQAVVDDVLARLGASDLIEVATEDDAGFSRRTVLGQAAGATAAGALVLSLALPSLAAADSGTSFTYTITPATHTGGAPGGFTIAATHSTYTANASAGVYGDDAGDIGFDFSAAPSNAPYVHFTSPNETSLTLALVQYASAGAATYALNDSDGSTQSGRVTAGAPITVGSPISGTVTVYQR